MRVDVLTIFPELFAPFLATSLLGKAIGKGLLSVAVHDLRAFTGDRHRSVDDEPYGGGGGMVMTAPPILRAVEAVVGNRAVRRVLMSPQGVPLVDARVQELGRGADLLLLCGRYEAIDERVLQTVVDEEISIGDYVLSGGELPAMVLIEAISRQIPGVVGLKESVENDSFRGGLLDYPHYTRPAVVAGLEVPAVLLSGDHAAIEAWRQAEQVRVTARKRPDLLARIDPGKLTAVQRRKLEGLGAEAGEQARNGRGVARQSNDPK